MSRRPLLDVSEAELGQSEPKGSDLREDNTREAPQQQIQLPLGVKLTGFRLLMIGLILGLGIPKIIYSYSGQSLISTTLDWVAGIALALILFWLGVISAQRPALFPRFFQADLAPPILKFLGLPEVQLWFLSLLPLMLGINQVRAMLDARRDNGAASWIPAHLITDGLTLAVLGFILVVITFCLQCLRVVRPRLFRATLHSFYIFHIPMVVWWAYLVYLAVKVTSRSKEYPPSIIKIAVHNVLWMYPFTLLPVPGQFHGHNEGHPLPLLYNGLYLVMNVVLTEALLTGVWGFPDFPESAFGICFSCCITIFFSRQFLISLRSEA